MQCSLVKPILDYHQFRVKSVNPIRTGKFNRCFLVKLAEPVEMKMQECERFILRVAPPDSDSFLFYEEHMMRQEPGLHRQIRQKTSLPVPQIYFCDQSRQLIDRDYLFMEWLPGKPVSEQTLSRKAFDHMSRQVGQYLRQLHDSVQNGQYGYLGEHRCMLPQHDWKSAFATMWTLLAEDIHKAGVFSEEEQAMAEDAFDRHQTLFHTPSPACLLHMDIWSQNILTDAKGNVTGLLDWDRGLWGDPEIEFAVLEYTGFDTPAFWEGYGRQPEKNAAWEIRYTFYHLYEVQKYLVIYSLRNLQGEERIRKIKDYSMKLLETLLKA